MKRRGVELATRRVGMIVRGDARLFLVPLVLACACPARGDWSSAENRDAATREAIQQDWMHQDYMAARLPAALEQEKQRWRDEHLTDTESRLDPPVLRRLACFISSDSCLVEQRMMARVCSELGERGDPFRARADQLARSGAPGRDPAWFALYREACSLRREIRLQPLLSRVTRFVLTRHRHIPASWKYTEVLSDAQTDRHRVYRPGATLDLLVMRGLYGQLQTLVEDDDGLLRNPDVSYDGQRVLFAWKKSDRGDDFHLYEMDVATRRIRQLTFGLGAADYEGVYLPDGNIAFSSTRCMQTVDCNWVEASNLYLIDGNGGHMRRVGFDQVHTIFPTVSDDGSVFYTRWEYSDRGQIYPQTLFEMHPDGTNQREFYGNNSWFPTNIIHARKIPGSRKVLTIVTGHHRPAHGKLAIIDPAVGRQEGQGVQLIAPVRETESVRVDRYALQGNQFQYPYPITDSHYLVSLALPAPDGTLGRFDIFFMDTAGRRELLAMGDAPNEGVGCKQIIPLVPRSVPHVRPSVADYRQDTGTLYLQDIYQGAGLRGVPQGSVKRLRVVALEYRAAAIGSLKQKGRGGESQVSTPIAIGNGAWDVKVVLGSTEVQEDGSAFFEVPARTPVYFQALDDKNRVVQNMRSWTTLLPGEHQSCVGCHEHKNTAPRADRPAGMALAAGPRPLETLHGPPRGFSFHREVQPILDRHCVSCHSGKTDGVWGLTGKTMIVEETKRRFSESYLALTHARGSNGSPNHPMVNWIDSMSEPTMLPPYHRGSATSQLLPLLEKGHEGVKLSRDELDRIACWIDLLVPYCGDYREANAWSAAEVDFYEKYAAKRRRFEFQEQANIRAMITAGDGSGRVTDSLVVQ
jgi:hypothetical protein